ncbi:MAG: YdjY domain-containing protein [Desulfuromonadales bacterium]|nr:YdjY domain-containing protein [Desulfuromonadales bacterium]
MTEKTEKGCSCCSGDSYSVLVGDQAQDEAGSQRGLNRGQFLKVMGLGVLGLSTIPGSKAFAAAEQQKNAKIVRGGGDRMVVDQQNKELRISATVTKNGAAPSVLDWGRRFQGFFGARGGKMESYFIFTTEVDRRDIDVSLQELGVTSRRQIPMEEVKQRTGLKPTTTRDDYLDGDPIICTIRFIKDGKIVEAAIEDFIEEKIEVGGQEVIKPYTPHFVYHGTAEAISFPSGCILCPSDCNGGIITDNVLPLKTTVNYYRINWDRMPPVGSKVEVVLRSIYGPGRMSSQG